MTTTKLDNCLETAYENIENDRALALTLITDLDFIEEDKSYILVRVYHALGQVFFEGTTAEGLDLDSSGVSIKKGPYLCGSWWEGRGFSTI